MGSGWENQKEQLEGLKCLTVKLNVATTLEKNHVKATDIQDMEILLEDCQI